MTPLAASKIKVPSSTAVLNHGGEGTSDPARGSLPSERVAFVAFVDELVLTTVEVVMEVVLAVDVVVVVAIVVVVVVVVEVVVVVVVV
eukprot:CAMPEP_0204502626 /NCGR_PEP_ID=MMETSP0471-20130131/101638_1 /ASSEMBLY_ACC=CAM_ASM_000602 /TAXON_ID=2969 /ORGANISM="Oxyrrhis marina" /LENGTH=87 /DNA_ID=CAMNT_0051507393 /DNA_START=342 /DNA_END=602 /DNA_ORIENTATION=-